MSGNWDLPQGRMNCHDDAEKASRILALAQVILKAGNALEDSNWQSVEMHAKEAARQARVIKMLEARQKDVDSKTSQK